MARQKRVAANKTAKKDAKKADSKLGAGCLVLFGLPFAAVGLVMGVLSARALWRWQEMKGWTEVPARILTAELFSNQGDDSTTYRVEATYEYVFGTHTYTGSRVSLSSGSDNIGSFHQDVYEELVPYRDSGRRFRCFVDPRDPGSAILYRQMRWGMLAFYMLFVVLFGGVGFGLMIAAVVGQRSAQRAAARRAERPAEPWQWKEEWASGVIRSSSRAQMLVAVAFAGFWNLISTPLLFLLPKEVEEGNYAALLGLIFPLVGLGLLIWAVRAVIRWLRFGESTFTMQTVPARIGGTLAGEVTAPGNLVPDDKSFALTLSCLRRVTSGSGKSRKTHEDAIWQERLQVRHESARRGRGQTRIPVAIPIPADAQPTSDDDAAEKILWRLEVEAAVPGVDYHATFEVPVFAGGAASPGPGASPDGPGAAGPGADDGAPPAGEVRFDDLDPLTRISGQGGADP